MLNQFEYPCAIKRDKAGFYLATFPDLPEAGTDGKTLDEAIGEAVDCLGEALASRLVDGEPIPGPSRPKRGQWVLAPESTLALKIALNQALSARRKTAADLARVLCCDHKEARRLLDPRQSSKAPRLTEALAALGYGVVINIYDQSKRERIMSSPLARRAAALRRAGTVRIGKRA